MKKVMFVLGCFFVLGCAKLTVGTKDPIKVDINMRVDVYQHVVDQAESINDQIYGDDGNTKLNSIFNMNCAYAADDSSQVSEAIQRRKDRADVVEQYFNKEYIGENKKALLEIIKKDLSASVKSQVKEVIEDENENRNIIYNSIAEKNGIKLEAVRKIFLKKDYERAPAGVWFQVYSEEKGKYIWEKK